MLIPGVRRAAGTRIPLARIVTWSYDGSDVSTGGCNAEDRQVAGAFLLRSDPPKGASSPQENQRRHSVRCVGRRRGVQLPHSGVSARGAAARLVRGVQEPLQPVSDDWRDPAQTGRGPEGFRGVQGDGPAAARETNTGG